MPFLATALGFLKGVPRVVWIGLAIIVAGYFYGEHTRNQGVLETEARFLNAPAVRDTVREMVHDTLHSTTTKYIQGRVDTFFQEDVSHLTLATLREAVQPFSISQPITAQDEHSGASVVATLQLTAHPLKHSIRDLSLSRVIATYPKETVTETRYVEATPPLLSLYVRGGIIGSWENPLAHKNLGGFEGGVKLRFGAVKIAFSPFGLGCIQNQWKPTRSLFIEIES